jgi:hypothetical protein
MGEPAKESTKAPESPNATEAPPPPAAGKANYQGAPLLNQGSAKFEEHYLLNLEANTAELSTGEPKAAEEFSEVWDDFEVIKDKLTNAGQQRVLGILYSTQNRLGQRGGRR